MFSPLKPRRWALRQELAHGGARQAQFQEVDGAVEVPQALHVAFALVHGRRQRRHDAITYEAHQKGLCSIAHPYSSFDNGIRLAGGALGAGSVPGDMAYSTGNVHILH